MGLIIFLIIVAIFAMFLESTFGKITIGSSVVAIGCLLLRWITGVGLFITLAKTCAIIMIVLIVIAILTAIFN